jgi:hypothetical protein
LFRRAAAAAAAVVLLAGCQPALRAPVGSPPPPVVVAERQVISPDDAGTVRELRRRGDIALLEQRWQDAAVAFRTLIAADRVVDDPSVSAYLLGLGMAEEGLGERASARDRYRDIAVRFPTSADARTASLRAIAVDDYLEDWEALGRAAVMLLLRTDLDDIDHLTGLGARALSAIESGDDIAAMRDVQDGLDLVDRSGLGATGRLPNGAAQLRFALAEVRRVRSERLELVPVTPDFLSRIEERCQGLLDAQSAYADAMRAMDPHWTAMSALRIGVMYAKLHADLMAIPPTEQAKTSAQRDLFFAMMHVRYRVLLEKAADMMKRTIALASQTTEVGPWVERARTAEAELNKALDDEKAALAKLPYSEATIQAALQDLEKKALAKRAKRPPAP